MTDFCIWGTVNQIGPQEFVVLVSAARDEIGEFDGAMLDRHIATSRALAVIAKNEMMRRMGEAIRARGDRVVNVHEE